MKVLSKKEEGEIKELLNREKSIEKEATILWDGSSFSVKLPKEIADAFNINEKNRIEKSILFKLKESTNGIETSFTIVPRTKKRKLRKNDKKTSHKK